MRDGLFVLGRWRQVCRPVRDGVLPVRSSCIFSIRMIDSSAAPWLEAGYAAFATRGPQSLRVEQLAREVGISKSSFYHHFTDLPSFIEALLHYHLERVKAEALRARAFRTIDPEFIRLLVEIRMDLMFNWQLRLHREELSYQLCYQRAHTLMEQEVMGIWSEALGIPGEVQLARNIFTVVTDLFYQRFPKDQLTYEWLVSFLQEVNSFMEDVLRRSGIRDAT
jgi:AcrR family transcriptional regulator